MAEGREFELPGDFTSKSFQMRRGGDRGVRLKEPPADCRKMSMCVPARSSQRGAGGVSTLRGEWHLFPWVGWQASG
jgi:hypothetical protein